MKLRQYELLVAGTWEIVKGSTLGLKDGWLSWTDGESNGLARPGTWREKQPAPTPKLTPEQRKAVRSLIEDSGYTRAEAVAIVLAGGLE